MYKRPIFTSTNSFYMPFYHGVLMETSRRSIDSSIQDPEITFYVLDMLRTLALAEEGLQEMARRHKRLFCWLQHQHILPTIWRILDSGTSQVHSLLYLKYL